MSGLSGNDITILIKFKCTVLEVFLLSFFDHVISIDHQCGYTCFKLLNCLEHVDNIKISFDMDNGLLIHVTNDFVFLSALFSLTATAYEPCFEVTDRVSILELLDTGKRYKICMINFTESIS